jgi:mRNA-degrading endonuclease toxin of MazEF toxin-antitoxin module
MRKRRITDEEIDAMGAEPRCGEVWWCEGEGLGFADGGKIRPVLIIGLFGDHASIVPLTTRKPANAPIAVAHKAGQSWLTDKETTVPKLSLLSSLGPWTGFAHWRRR